MFELGDVLGEIVEKDPTLEVVGSENDEDL